MHTGGEGERGVRRGGTSCTPSKEFENDCASMSGNGNGLAYFLVL
jgi:hypothetical protein